MVTLIIATIAVAFVVAALLMWRFPEITRVWVGRIKAARKGIFAVISFFTAIAFVGSGQPLLMFIGLLIFIGFAIAILDGPVKDRFGVSW